MKSITILGSTGSIGINTLDVISHYPEQFSVFALTAHHRVEILLEQCIRFKPEHVVIVDEVAANTFRVIAKEKHLSTQIHSGVEALCDVASDPKVDYVMAAIVGAAGLLPSLAAAKAGKRVLLANKEALVMTGSLFMEAIRESGGEILPIDSEHNAIFQSLPEAPLGKTLTQMGVKKLILTASGGPFLTTSREKLVDVTPEQAIAHPNWKMGRKISVDSATMMNKGLELIEAYWLFGAYIEQLDVVIHPQSVIHSMVEYVDGSVMAELGIPDMRTPIAYGLGYPIRISPHLESLDLVKVGQLTFSALSVEQFPCTHLAYEALKLGGTAPVILNAANEVAVEAFLSKKLRFLGIPEVINQTLHKLSSTKIHCLEDVLEADRKAREIAWSSLLPLV
jgi:1-deoxy-D-xylulose-5-phosphate reductoisomerase